MQLIKYTAEFDDVLESHIESKAIKIGQKRRHKNVSWQRQSK